MPTNADDALIAARMLQDAARSILAADVDALALLHRHPGRLPAATHELLTLANAAADAGQAFGLEPLPQPVAVLAVEVLTTPEGVTFTPWTDGAAVGYIVTRATDDQVEHVFLNPSTGTGEGEGTGNVFLYAGTGTDTDGSDPLSHVAFFEQA